MEKNWCNPGNKSVRSIGTIQLEQILQNTRNNLVHLGLVRAVVICQILRRNIVKLEGLLAQQSHTLGEVHDLYWYRQNKIEKLRFMNVQV